MHHAVVAPVVAPVANVLRFETVYFYTTKYVMNLTRSLSQLFLREFKILTSGISCDTIVSRTDVLRNRANPTELMFILIPQLMVVGEDALPDPNKYCIYQLEQLNDKHGGAQETTTIVKTELDSPLMVALIRGSIASYDYSAVNLKYYPASLHPKICVLPPPVYIYAVTTPNLIFNSMRNDDAEAYKSDILFYGGMNHRRERILSQIMKPLQNGHGYKIIIVNRVFGDELLKYIFNTRVVLNIHYYANSILETDRIHTALQFDHVKLVSEYPTQCDALLPTYKAHHNRILFCNEISDRFVVTSELIKACVCALAEPTAPPAIESLPPVLNALCAAEIRRHCFPPVSRQLQ